MLHDILWPKIPIGAVNRWSNSHALQFGAVQEIFHQFTGLLRTSRGQSSYVIKASQSILISHLLLITIPCKRNSGLRVIGYFTSPREKGREEIGERQSRDRKRDGRLLGTTSPTKKTTLCKNSSISEGKCHCAPIKIRSLPGHSPSLGVYKALYNSTWQIHHSNFIAHSFLNNSCSPQNITSLHFHHSYWTWRHYLYMNRVFSHVHVEDGWLHACTRLQYQEPTRRLIVAVRLKKSNFLI